MKAIHGGKTKNDKIDSYKLAILLKGGNLPVAYAYPVQWRATSNLPAFNKKLFGKYNLDAWPNDLMPITLMQERRKNHSFFDLYGSFFLDTRGPYRCYAHFFK